MPSVPDIKVRVKVEGGDKVARRLQMLAQEVASKHMREAAKKGAEEFLARAKENAPKGKTGILKEDMMIEIVKETKSQVQYGIGPGKKGWYGRLVEYGHKIVLGGSLRSTKKNPVPQGKHVGNVKPHPFLRPTFDSANKNAEKAVVDEIRRRLKLL